MGSQSKMMIQTMELNNGNSFTVGELKSKEV